MDPESAGKYYRSVTGNLARTTADVTGAPFAPAADTGPHPRTHAGAVTLSP